MAVSAYSLKYKRCLREDAKLIAEKISIQNLIKFNVLNRKKLYEEISVTGN
jgi:hypothetical protein